MDGEHRRFGEGLRILRDREDTNKIIRTLEKEGTLTTLGKAAIDAHSKLQDGEGLSFYNIFKKGAEWMAEQAEQWLAENIKDYVSYDGEVFVEDLKDDFQRAMKTLTDEKQ